MDIAKKMLRQMPRVPLWMREESKESNEDYEPKVVSLGPYHHGKEKLKFIQDFKPIAVEMFIQVSGGAEERDYIHAILMEIEYIRSCYTEESTSMYTDEVLARMMLQDGCLILNCIAEPYRESIVRIRAISEYLGFATVHTIMRRDMYLLENQIPLRILEILVYLRYKTTRETFIKEIAKNSFKMFFRYYEGITKVAPPDLESPESHLLAIFQSVITRGSDHDDHGDHEYCLCDVKGMLLRLKELGCCKDEQDEAFSGEYVFRSMTNLKSKGIHLRVSKIKSVLGIRFSPTGFLRSAELKLPPMYVDMYTRALFQNVIAYELSPHDVYVVEKKVTTYVGFMKLLVVTAEDAKELRESRIMVNSLGSDDDAVQLYKDLNTYGAVEPSYYLEVMENLEKHYNSTRKMWMANLRSTYFSNPWTIIALVASLLVLCLDIAQTYYAAKSANQS